MLAHISKLYAYNPLVVRHASDHVYSARSATLHAYILLMDIKGSCSKILRDVNWLRISTFSLAAAGQGPLHRQRPHHVENTGSRLITAVKQRRAWLVLGWETAWEPQVLLSSYLLPNNCTALCSSLAMGTERTAPLPAHH